MTMSSSDCVGAFMYGLTLLVVDDLGLVADKCDPTDLAAVGGASVLTYQLAVKSETPADCALCRLAVMTGALLAAQRGPDGARIAQQWHQARNEYYELCANGSR